MKRNILEEIRQQDPNATTTVSKQMYTFKATDIAAVIHILPSGSYIMLDGGIILMKHSHYNKHHEQLNKLNLISEMNGAILAMTIKG